MSSRNILFTTISHCSGNFDPDSLRLTKRLSAVFISTVPPEGANVKYQLRHYTDVNFGEVITLPVATV